MSVSLKGNYICACSKVTAFKLVDVPELGYTTADLPNPRGELRIKTRNMISEYYKDAEVLTNTFVTKHTKPLVIVSSPSYLHLAYLRVVGNSSKLLM